MKNPKAEIRVTKETRSPRSEGCFPPPVAADVSRLKLTEQWSGLTSAATPVLNEPPENRLRPARSGLAGGGPPPRFHVSDHNARGLARSNTWRTGVALGVLLSALCLSASAQYSIPWWTIDAGGGTSSGGVFRVSGTLGQPEAGGPMTGGPFTLTGGFWVLPQVVQTPDAPTLSIAPAAPGWATLTWTPAVGVPWVLQEAPAVTGPWSDVAGGGPPPRLVPATPPARFYRLYKP